MELATVVDELYGLPPEAFTATRDERAREARAAKDRDLAKVIGTLRKPSASAWAINIAARESPADVGALLELGEALRAAQSGRSGDLRELLARRQGVVATAVERVRITARTHDHPLSEAGATEVEQTLRAAMADPDIADLVRAGCLVGAVTTSVLGGFDLAAIAAAPVAEIAPARAVPESKPAAAKTPPAAEPRTTEAKQDDRAAAAQQRVDAAERDLALSEQTFADARADTERAEAEVARLQALVDDLRERLRDAERQLEGAEKARIEAVKAVEASELAVADSRADAEAARHDLVAAG